MILRQVKNKMFNDKEDYRGLISLNEALYDAEKKGYAVGSFSPRYTSMIAPVLRAGQKTNSVLIVQISQNELNWYQLDVERFASEFFRVMKTENISVPVVLHLDHTRKFSIIKDAIAAGFSSVMIDASKREFRENAKISRRVVEYAHQHGVSVEAELGRIGTTDFVETDEDEELFTEPDEASRFVEETGVDALAVSVGTAHGVYNKINRPYIDYQRLKDIKKLTSVYLVLHGGSGVPAEMVINSIKLPDGGISKVNIATDLEQAFLNKIGSQERMTDEECKNLDDKLLNEGQGAVEEVVIDKIKNFLGSEGSAAGF